ncbi:MAG: TetR/AcrR family transcriptional regulator [Zetaproteobacteria bacterium]|nr:TetR/AcrR family transcriptional regulator [Zetaproteobacteria bacterium]
MPRTDVAEERKEQIVKATIHCITQHGYDNFSMQDVARKAGISKGIIHYYFLNKDDLMMSVLENVSTRIEASVLHTLEKYSGAEKRLQIFVEACLDTVQNTKEYYQVSFDFWSQVQQKTEVRNLFLSHYERLRKICSDILQEGIHEKSFQNIDVSDFSNFILSIIDGISLQYLLNGSQVTFECLSNIACRQIMEGVLSSSSGTSTL